MSDPLEATVPAPACSPASKARAARLAKFKREHRIVEYLNRGVSVAEIAAQVGVGEKRMRAVIREILARRMPHPPEEFVAIQMSRLNEALLVAYSAMSPSNLKAVDQVVKIVRELDRYGGAFAAEWARPAASRLDAPAEEDVAFAKAWLSDGELESESSDDRPETPAQCLENIESAPGLLQTPEARADTGAASDGRPAREAALRGLAAEGRPEIPLQGFEKIESAPGFVPLAPLSPSRDGRLSTPYARGEGWGEGLRQPPIFSSAPHPSLLPVNAEKGFVGARPENPTQSLEKVQSAPGIGLGPQTAEPTAASPVSTPDLMLSMLRSAAGRQDLRVCLSRLRPDTHDVPRQRDGGDFPFAATARHARPENLAQRLENMESAPEIGWLALAAAASGLACPEARASGSATSG